ncbi:MAG: hypothetical protein GX664_01670 [Bacteroidales bacterium]|nr:hypothetical protein [Bacteroidales bacterium]
MERSNINYKGIDYPTIEIALSKVSNIESNELVTITDCQLWAAIEDDYEDGDKEAVWIDNNVYFYCDSGFIASNPTESEIIEYMNKYC